MESVQLGMFTNDVWFREVFEPRWHFSLAPAGVVGGACWPENYRKECPYPPGLCGRKDSE